MKLLPLAQPCASKHIAARNCLVQALGLFDALVSRTWAFADLFSLLYSAQCPRMKSLGNRDLPRSLVSKMNAGQCLASLGNYPPYVGSFFRVQVNKGHLQACYLDNQVSYVEVNSESSYELLTLASGRIHLHVITTRDYYVMFVSAFKC